MPKSEQVQSIIDELQETLPHFSISFQSFPEKDEQGEPTEGGKVGILMFHNDQCAEKVKALTNSINLFCNQLRNDAIEEEE